MLKQPTGIFYESSRRVSNISNQVCLGVDRVCLAFNHLLRLVKLKDLLKLLGKLGGASLAEVAVAAHVAG